MPKLALFATLLVALVAFAACGSDSNGEPEADGQTATPVGTTTEAEQAYLDELAGVTPLIVENFDKFFEILTQVYETRGALFGALEEAGAGTTFDAGLAHLEALEPPERYRDEHALAVDALREIQRIDRQVGQAVVDVDLVAFAFANVELGRVTNASPLQHSEEFCFARYDSRHLCERPDFSSSPGYGEELYSILSRFETEAGPAVGAGAPSMNDEETLEVANALAPGAVATLEEIAEGLAALSPPESLQADHDLIVRYAGDVLELATEWRDAAERGDLAATQAQIGPIFELFCTTAGELSPAITPIVVVHFGNLDPCAGPPPGLPPGPP